MLSETQVERYSRQIILPQVGGRGQEKLLSAGVAVAADGTAAPTVAAYLSAAGIGRLAIVDLGALATSRSEANAANGGRAGAVGRRTFTPLELAALNPDCAVRQLPPPHSCDEAFALVRQYDIVIVGEARSLASAVAVEGTALLNAACLDLRKPLLWARVDGVVGCLTHLAGGQASAPCYRCLLPQLPRSEADNARAPWAAALAASVIGSMQATEAIKILLGMETTLFGRLVTWNCLGAEVQERAVVRDPSCTTCSATAAPWLRTGVG